MDFERISEELETLIDTNEKLVYENYNDKEDQILIDKKLTEEMLAKIASFVADENLQKETLKKVLRELFELQPQDLLILKDGYIFIKLVSELEQKIPQGRKSSHEARYNGYDEKELIEFYNDFFTPQEVDTLIKEVAQEFVKRFIIKKHISNEEYEKRVFAHIKNLFYEKLVKRFENDDEFLMGFAGYIFRINFEKLFIYLAEELLEKMAKGDQRVIDFLQYYSHDVIIQNGVKYAVPSIESPAGHKWKNVSILSIVRVYVNTKENIARLKHQIEKLQKKAKEFYTQDGKSPLELQKYIKEATLHLNNEINEHTKIIQNYQELLQNPALSTVERHETNKKITLEKNEIQRLSEQKKNLSQISVPEHMVLQYQKNQRELDSLKRELINKLRVLEQNQKSYEEIKHALVKALIKKKRKIVT